MASSGDSPKSGGAFQTILVGVVVALVAGGSAPWWLNFFKPPAQAPSHTSQAYMGSFEEGVNYARGDIPGMNAESPNEQECANRCQKENRCKAMTFVRHPTGSGGICWLKDTVGDSSAHPGMVSSIKQFSQTGN